MTRAEALVHLEEDQMTRLQSSPNILVVDPGAYDDAADKAAVGGMSRWRRRLAALGRYLVTPTACTSVTAATVVGPATAVAACHRRVSLLARLAHAPAGSCVRRHAGRRVSDLGLHRQACAPHHGPQV